MIAVIAGLIGFYALLAVCLWRRERRRPLERDQIIAAAVDRAAARELDQLELLYSLPAYDPAWDAGCERMWDAIRDEQQNQKGDTGHA